MVLVPTGTFTSRAKKGTRSEGTFRCPFLALPRQFAWPELVTYNIVNEFKFMGLEEPLNS